ncbi:LPS export ABC transporter periplasmic protein LptC [Telmatobacter bradus]|uniref:LPS export ABC transporter periplasmic protein LptC n=1 Tax=Telmatobacter bradus TaxID=474953 RepID=UPI003B42B4F1
MRLTIERLRALILVAALLLLAALVGFLAFGKWKSHFVSHDLPQKLGLDIQQESDGVTFSHALGAHAQFKVKASKVVQLKQGNALLHNVKIEIYGEDGNRVDRIEGNEFEYDQKTGLAKATGPVEITLARPDTAPASASKTDVSKTGSDRTGSSKASANKADGQVHIKTTLLTFNWNTGIASTTQKVDFSTAQGTGSSIGSTYDSRGGYLELDHNVQMNSIRNGEAVQVNADHAEFAHSNMLCTLYSATASYHDSKATAGQARIEFRADGTAVQLDATGGFTLTTATGSRIVAPHGTLEFDEHSQPRHGHLSNGVTMDSLAHGRLTHGSATSADLEFTPQGSLHHAHLEQNVTLHTVEDTMTAGTHPEPLHLERNWHSPVAEIDFRNAGKGNTEPSALTGTGGVELTSHSQRGKEPASDAHMHADRVDGQFTSRSTLSALTGTGHATMEQNTASGAHQTATGERIQARFGSMGNKGQNQLQAAVLEQHVLLTQLQPSKAGAPAPAPLRATAGRAEYAGDGQWLHLTVNPRVDQGGMQLTADKIDVSEESGDAFAHGNVKATWSQSAQPGQHAPTLGGQDPAHVVSAEAEVHQSQNGQDATFRGHARLWQQANAVTAPTIVLKRQQQTLEAYSSDRNEPVRVTMLNNQQHSNAKQQQNTPTVLRVRGGNLKYTDSNRTAFMQGGALGPVIAETSAATTQSSEVELHLAQASNHASAGSAQVEQLIARGHVTVSSEGRHGTGEQLTYTGSSGEYVLTGANGSTPKLTDPEHGTVSGQALIFHSRDDSVSIEGRGQKTTTNTYAPR